jgi:hypothetical protein
VTYLGGSGTVGGIQRLRLIHRQGALAGVASQQFQARWGCGGPDMRTSGCCPNHSSIRTLYLRTLCSRTIVPNLGSGVRWLGAGRPGTPQSPQPQPLRDWGCTF